MEHKTWTTMDKAGWGDGPWQSEPDKEQFADEATGLPCLVKRSPMSGSLCGYVGVSEGHPWFGKGYGDLEGHDADGPDVHGGLTFADFCQEGPEEATICHVPGPGEPDRVYWLGFDCAHAWDLSPARAARERESGMPDYPGLMQETYKTVAFVKAQCASLAAQAVAVAGA
jgi:hypothetical protein